jgi:outer membrane protein assembly factor BamB
MGAPIAAAPAVAEGLVIVTSLGGKVAAVTLDGKERWSRELGDRIYGAPLAQGGLVRVGVDGGKLVTLDARTGQVKATLEVDGDADTAPAPTQDGGFVFAAGKIAYGARRDGTVRWRYKHRRKLYAAPAVGDDGTAYFGAQGGAVLAIAPDGELRWKAALGSDADAGLSVRDDGTVLAGNDGGEVVALAPRDGAIRWRAALGGFVRGALAVGRDGAVLASTYGPAPAVVALDGASGSELWRFPVRGTGSREFGVHGAPLEDAEGTLIFGAQDDVLRALTPEGTERWKLQLGGDIDGTAVLTEELLLVGCGDGHLYALGEGG